MKRLLLFVLLLSLFAPHSTGTPLRQNLHSDWKFKQVRGYNWYPATVPGGVHTDLLDNQLIDDPFFRLNERGMQWIDKEDWLYETSFDVTDDVLKKENIHLRFDGLDTYADVTLNGVKILSADNMFREWETDVKSLLKPNGNTLQVYFHSPIKKALPLWEALPFRYEASNDQSENGGMLDKQVSVFVRKAGYHFGWDWGPRLVASGIWRPVYLEAWDVARINNVQYTQTSVTAQEAVVDVTVEITATEATDAWVSVLNQTDKKTESKKQVTLKKGLNKIPLTFKMKKPRLWWTNGLGEAFLYDFSTQLSLNNQTVEVDNQKIGIRSLKVITKPDAFGESFYFELNGKPIFAKGSNYIPCDNFLTRVTDSIYDKTIRDAVDANMNMLRVWGGGIYENDIFYDLCDKYGILVWQDMMFACSMYPAEGDLLENIRLETIDNVRRLRNHPSIALWAGNNECLDAWFNWGWKRNQDKKDIAVSELMWKQFKALYFETLPAIIAEYHPGACYRKSSPYSDDQGTRNHTVGDMHYWEVWQGLKPLSAFLDEKSRFFSEYGFQSFPEFASIQKYAPQPVDWAVTSEVMMSHQRGGQIANQRINNFLLSEYHAPKDFPAFVYMSQLLQADAMKLAMESHRRDMPYCMGSLVWQHNDCWPVASWSSRDYYGRWKAQHYFTVKSFADILIAPIEKDGELQVYVVSDRLKKTSGTLTVQVIDIHKGLTAQQEIPLTVPENTSTLLWKNKVNELLHGLNKEDAVIHLEYHDKQGKVYENNHFLVSQKEVKYDKVVVSHTITPVAGGYELTLSTDKFVRGVFISLNGKDDFITDNYFDLLPNKSSTVLLKTTLPLSVVKENLTIKSFADAY